MSTFLIKIWSIFVLCNTFNFWRVYCQPSNSVERQLQEQNIQYNAVGNDIIIDNQVISSNITLRFVDETFKENKIYFKNMIAVVFNSLLFSNSSFYDSWYGGDGFINFFNIMQVTINSVQIEQIQLKNLILILSYSSRFNIGEIQVSGSIVIHEGNYEENISVFEFRQSQVRLNKIRVDQLDINSLLIKITLYTKDDYKSCEIYDIQITESIVRSPLLNLTSTLLQGFSMDKITFYQLKTSLIILHNYHLDLGQLKIPDEGLSKKQSNLQQNHTSPLLKINDQRDGEESPYYNSEQLSFIIISKENDVLTNITDSYFNFEFMLMRFILFQNNGSLILENTQLFNMRAVDDGGCIYLSPYGSSYFTLLNSILNNCKSANFGGAIFGGRPKALSYGNPAIFNTTISNCSSNIGGGVFLLLESSEANQITYQDNKAVAYPDYYYCKMNHPLYVHSCRLFVIDSMYQLNRDLQNTTYYQQEIKVTRFNFNYLGQYSVSSILQRGFVYLMKLNVIEGNSTVQIPQNTTFGNMYKYLNDDFLNSYLPFIIQGVNFPYLVIQYQGKFKCREDMPDYWLYNIEILQGIRTDYNEGCFKVQDECIQGQKPEMVQLPYSELQAVCSYCPEGQFSYESDAKCQTCQYTIFDRCYVNNTSLKPSFWRSKLSNELNQVSECTLSRKNCQGANRFSVANQLCTQGYVGVMCLGCDVHAEFWETPYGSNGAYNCVACSSLENNTAVIYVMLIIFLFLLTLTLQTNFKRMKNQIFRKYLSQLGIIYIGSSFVSQSLGSVYLKLLIFNFQIYSATRIFTESSTESSLSTFENLLPSFLNPTNVFGYSFDCFIINYKKNNNSLVDGNGDVNQYYIGEIKLIITVLLPLIVSAFVLILLSILTLLKLFRRRYILSVLFHAYFYLTMFQIQPQLIQYSIESLQVIELPYSDNECYNLFDTSISCQNTTLLTRMRMISIFSLLCYTILTPFITLLFVLVLKKKSQKVMFRFTLGFLTDEYKSKYIYWEFVRIFLLISLSILISLLKSQPLIMGLIYLSILTIYLYQIHLWHPYQQNKLNLIEQKSIIVSIIYFLSSLCYSINNQNGASSKLLSSFGSTLTKIIYYTAKTCQFIFVLWIVVLIFISYFQIALRKLQRFSIINRLSNIFPYVLTKIYSKRLIENLEIFRKRVRENLFIKQECIFKELDLQYNENSSLIQTCSEISDNLN